LTLLNDSLPNSFGREQRLVDRLDLGTRDRGTAWSQAVHFRTRTVAEAAIGKLTRMGQDENGYLLTCRWRRRFQSKARCGFEQKPVKCKVSRVKC